MAEVVLLPRNRLRDRYRVMRKGSPSLPSSLLTTLLGKQCWPNPAKPNHQSVGKWIEIQNRGAKRKKPTNTTIANSVSNAPTTQRCRQKEYDAAKNTKPTENPMPRKTRAGNHSTCRGESGGKCKASAACLTPRMRFQPIKAVQGTPITSVMTAGIKCQGMVRRGVSSTTGTSYGLAFIGDRCGESRFWVVSRVVHDNV